jgi:hypothetical protein
LVHPRAGAETTPKTKITAAVPLTAAPNQSTGVACSSREVATVQPSAKISAAATTKAQKIACQEKKSSNSPDPSIPMTAPEPATPAQIPTALMRSPRG